MERGDTKGTFGKPPQNWNGISRFVEHSNVTKEYLTGDTVPVCGGFSKLPLVSPRSILAWAKIYTD